MSEKNQQPSNQGYYQQEPNATMYYQQPQQPQYQQQQPQPQQQQQEQQPRGKGKQFASNFIKRLWDAIIFGAGASIGNRIVNSICS